ERFTGHMGMFNLHHVLVHLRSNLIRRQGGLHQETCLVSGEAGFVSQIPTDFDGLYTLVPQARVRELLETRDDRYQAVLSDRKGCCNSAVLLQQVLAYLERQYPERFRYVDHTSVDRVVVSDDEVLVHARGHSVGAAQVVMCTNGFVDHLVADRAGQRIRLASDQLVIGRVAYMTAFVDEPRSPTALSYIRNTTIGGETAYA